MSEPGARKHRGTGKPRGGKRDGAGRPEGSTNTLEYGQVRAVKAAGLRVPVDANPEERELADECLGTITSVMRGEISFVEAGVRMKAATHLREEICGPMAKQVNLADANGDPLQVSVNINLGEP